MVQPGSSSLEERARQILAGTVGPRLDAAALPLHTMAAQGTPSRDELKDLLAQQPTAVQGSEQAKRPVSEMTAVERLVEAYNRADISDAVRARIDAALSPQALAGAILTFAAVFVASQFTPVGWAEDIALGLTAVFLGTAVLRAAQHLIQFAGAADATTDAQLTAAGHAFAQACAELEVDALLFLIAKAAGGTGGGPPANVPASAGMVLATQSGQLVMVAVDTIPEQVAAQWGVLGGGTMSMAMTGSGDGDGDDPEPAGGGERKQVEKDGPREPVGGTGGGKGEPPGGSGGAKAAVGPSLLQQARAAGVGEEIEGEVEVFAHGTSSQAAQELIDTSGGSLSSSGGNFGGDLHTVPDVSVAKVFAQRTAGRISGGRGQPSVVGIALPRKVADALRQRGLLRVEPIQNPPPGVGESAQQWVFKPGAFPDLQKYGFFFPIQ